MGTPDIAVVGTDDLPPPVPPSDLPWQPVLRVDDALFVRVVADGGAGSDWHTHGERAAYGVVLEGSLRLSAGSGDAAVVEAGEFFRVPAGTVHRDATEEGCVALVALVGPGEPFAETDAPDGPPERPPQVAGEADLVATSPLAGLTRRMPFPDAPVQQVRGHADGQIASDWHHHGDNAVVGYVLRGEGYVAWGTDESERKRARAGEFFHVPAGVVHRDVNPTDDEQDYVLWLTGSEPRTVPVEEPP